MEWNDEPYAEMLRVVGRFLDRERALRAKVVDDGFRLTVSWTKDDVTWQQEAFRKSTLIEDLVPRARRDRATASAGNADESSLGWEERFRTLGQQLDREGLELHELTDLQGIRITGMAGDAPVQHVYSADELLTLSRERRADRKGTGQRTGWWRRLLPDSGR